MDLRVQEKVKELAMFIGMSEDKVIEMAVNQLYNSINPPTPHENVKKLQYFKERGILTKGLAKDICRVLLEKGKQEVLRLLRIKAEKRRFCVDDDKLISEFMEFMQGLIISSEPALIVENLSEVFIDLKNILPSHLIENIAVTF